MTDSSSSICEPQPQCALESEDHAQTSTPILRVEGLGVWYRLINARTHFLKQAILQGAFNRRSEQFWALRDISFSCYEGQVLGLVWDNGAGKSTLCLTLAGIIEPDEGTLDVQGVVTPLLGLGRGLNRQLTGRENILLYGSFLGIRRSDALLKMDEIIEFSGLDRFIDQPVQSYSSGMCARLSFSVASLFDPDVLILDEVLGVGDIGFQERSRAKIEELMKNSRLIIIASHSMPFLRNTCTHCLWIDNGQQRAFGETAAVLDMYEQSRSGGG